jgi:outer membrane lipoprotein SlyB
MNKRHAMATAVISLSAALAGCASTGVNDARPQSYPTGARSYPQPARSNYSSYGVIDSIQMSNTNGGGTNGIGAGTVVGGLVGGILGNQVGGGRGKTAATVAGVVGGAVVGNQIEQRNSVRQMYQVGVRLDNGGYRTLLQDGVGDLQVGSRVRIENDRVYRY